LLQQLQSAYITTATTASGEAKRLKKILERLDLRLNPVIFIPLDIILQWDLQQAIALENWKKRNQQNITAWFDSLAQFETLNSFATLHFNHPEWSFPTLHEEHFYIAGKNVGHPLINKEKRVDNPITIDHKGEIMLVTGSNMAGKSTFIKAVGSAVFLAHTGMGVPAQQMQLTLFDGLLSNINVVDNIVKGESYFYNEVQRIKATVTKVNDGKKWLILIDELFKGTNVQDAMKCSATVIEGLLKIKNSLFILSTHLYEIGEELKKHSNISFKYFETSTAGDQLTFSYQLKNGISNDRLGYLILKREGVVDLLERL